MRNQSIKKHTHTKNTEKHNALNCKFYTISFAISKYVQAAVEDYCRVT